MCEYEKVIIDDEYKGGVVLLITPDLITMGVAPSVPGEEGFRQVLSNTLCTDYEIEECHGLPEGYVMIYSKAGDYYATNFFASILYNADYEDKGDSCFVLHSRSEDARVIHGVAAIAKKKVLSDGWEATLIPEEELELLEAVLGGVLERISAYT